jgi:hypothetical protein
MRGCWGCGAVLGATLAVATDAHAYSVRQTTAGAPVHWATNDITLELDPTLVAAVPDADLALASAAEAWSSGGSGPTISLKLGAGSDGPAVDGRNVVYFAPGGYAQAEGALAITLVSYDEDSGAIVDTDIVVNGSYSFAVLAATARATEGAAAVWNDPTTDATGATAASSPAAGSGPFDLVHVLTHEAGHVLGLLDANDEPLDVMFVYTSVGDASRRAPSEDDLAGVASLYPEAARTSGGCSASPEAPRDERHGILALSAFAAGTFLLGARRRRRGRPR